MHLQEGVRTCIGKGAQECTCKRHVNYGRALPEAHMPPVASSCGRVFSQFTAVIAGAEGDAPKRYGIPSIIVASGETY